MSDSLPSLYRLENESADIQLTNIRSKKTHKLTSQQWQELTNWWSDASKRYEGIMLDDVSNLLTEAYLRRVPNGDQIQG